MRNVYYMNIDGTGRIRVAYNGRQPCWSPDGRAIAYLKGEFPRYSTRPYATSELLIYDLETSKHKAHPNKKLHHLFNICWSPDGNWFVASVEGGMGYSQAILAFEADEMKVLPRTNGEGELVAFKADGKRTQPPTTTLSALYRWLQENGYVPHEFKWLHWERGLRQRRQTYILAA